MMRMHFSGDGNKISTTTIPMTFSIMKMPKITGMSMELIDNGEINIQNDRRISLKC